MDVEIGRHVVGPSGATAVVVGRTSEEWILRPDDGATTISVASTTFDELYTALVDPSDPPGRYSV